MLTTIAALLAIGETLSWGQALAVVMISFGILAGAVAKSLPLDPVTALRETS